MKSNEKMKFFKYIKFIPFILTVFYSLVYFFMYIGYVENLNFAFDCNRWDNTIKTLYSYLASYCWDNYLILFLFPYCMLILVLVLRFLRHKIFLFYPTIIILIVNIVLWESNIWLCNWLAP